VKSKEAVKTEEVERTGGKAKEADPCWVIYSIVKKLRRGWQWLCLFQQNIYNGGNFI